MSMFICPFKVEYHGNAKYENPLKISEKNDMYWSKVNVSNNVKKIYLAMLVLYFS